MGRQVESNYAFIDGQNLNLGMRSLGWKLDYERFRAYLSEKYQADKAYLFIGYISKYEPLYEYFLRAGFALQFKPITQDYAGNVKGNVDADLVLRALLESSNYDKAVIVSSDGDFYSLVKHLYDTQKLATVLSPEVRKCSRLLRQAAREKIHFMDNLRPKLAYK
jgi:uncharacterized LabA/DUF88 family protein